LLVETAHLLTLLKHLSLKASDLFLALTNLRGEPDRHTLGLDLQVPLDIELVLEEGDLLHTKGLKLIAIRRKKQVMGVGRRHSPAALPWALNTSLALSLVRSMASAHSW
jgi:hypothetical protein